MEEKKTCCFFGHRTITNAETVRCKLYKIVEELILHHHVETFLFGSKSAFDDLCHGVLTELKEKYPHLRRIYVRAEYPEINDSYEKLLLCRYEETYFPTRAIGAGPAVYIQRNFEMVDKSDYCIVYYMEDYAPPMRKNSKKDLLPYTPKSGTKIAYEYAEKKKKNIINIAKL